MPATKVATAEETGTRIPEDGPRSVADLPLLLTPEEVARLLRTTKRAIYARKERGLLPGAVHVGRKLLFRRDAVLDTIGLASRAPSPKEKR